MKKFMAILLFFIFANFGFAPVFANSNTKNILEIKVGKGTVQNLKSAVDVFENEYNDFCKNFSESKICQDEKKFSQYKNSVAIKDGKFNEKDDAFFEKIYGFWTELTSFQSIRDKDSAEITSRKKGELASQILAIKKQIDIDGLKKLLDQERDALKDLSTDKEKPSYAKLPDGNSISKKDLNANDTELSKYKKDGIKVEPHNGSSDIILPDDDLSGKDENELKKILEDLKQLSDKVKNEKTKTQANIDALKAKKADDDKNAKEQEDIEKLKAQLLAEKQKEAKLIKDITGVEPKVEKFDDRIDLNKGLKNIPEDENGNKNPFKGDENHELRLDKKTNAEQKKALEDELANVKKINERLQKIKNAKDAKNKQDLDDCKKELSLLIRPDEINPPNISLKQCQDQLANKKKEQQDKIDRIRNAFDELKKIIQQITDYEIVIFDKSDVMATYVQSGNTTIKLYKHITDDMKKYQPLGYSDDGDNKKITFKQNIGNECSPQVKNLGVLTYNDMDKKSIKELEKWVVYVEKLIEKGNNNLTIMKSFIDKETAVCPNGHNNEKLKTEGDSYKLYDAVEECLKTEQDAKCLSFEKTISSTDVVRVLKGLGKYVSSSGNECVKDMNVKNCDAYILEKGFKKIDVKISISATVDDTSYLKKCFDEVNRLDIEKKKNDAKSKLNYTCNPKFTEAEISGFNSMWTEAIKTRTDYDKIVDEINAKVQSECLKKQIEIAKKNCAKIVIDNPVKTTNPIDGIMTEFKTVGDVVNACNSGIAKQCSKPWNFTKIETLDNNAITVAKNELAECWKSVNSDQCIEHQTGIIGKIKQSLNFNTVEQTPPQCFKTADEIACKEYAKKVSSFDFSVLKNNPANTKDDYKYIDECVGTVDRLFAIKEAIKKCNSKENLIDENKTYSSINAVKDSCFNAIKDKCPNKSFAWGDLNLDNMNDAYDKLERCKVSQKDVLRSYLVDNFENICGMYKEASSVKHVSTGSYGTVYNNSGHAEVYLNDNKIKTVVADNLSSIKSYAEKFMDYCSVSDENIDIPKTCYEQKVYDKESKQIATLSASADFTIERIMIKSIGVVCGRDVMLNTSKLPSSKNYKRKSCKYAAIIRNNCQ